MFGQVNNGQQFGSPRPTLGRAFGSGVINEDPAHGLGGGGKEVGLVLERYSSILADAQKSLVNQGRGLQRVTRSLSTQTLLRDGSKVLVYER